MRKTPLFFMVIWICIFCALAAQAVPPLIHYQGRLFNRATGAPENGPFRMAFRLFDGPETEAVELWFEVYDSNLSGDSEDVLVEQGFYRVQLGSLNPLSPEIFSATDVYLEIQVGNDPPMSPRQQILTAPYAFQAQRLEGLPARDFLLVSDFVRHASQANAHHEKTTRAGEITEGVFDDARIPGTVARLVDLQVFFDHIANTTGNPHQVDLTQAAADTEHDDLLGTGTYSHDQLDAHILGQGQDRPVAPRNDHACPEDMVQIGDSCIDIEISPDRATWFEAAVSCTSQGKRLCLGSEWYAACVDGDNLALEDIGTESEWIDQWASSGVDEFLKPVSMGSVGGCGTVRTGGQTSSRLRYRCCK